ncbi:hypothetical protein IFM89_008213 [Coptis chinensis]|uniref:Uncharacterized protein n=1 Tax=Coptis chinensis TaxID=261450 RepID=A0A835GWH3_9MAGN|nr:hypothetical protein IFM89_008213 [Coptis chinensis]
MRYLAKKKLSKEVERLQNPQGGTSKALSWRETRKSPRKRKENNDDMRGTQVGLDNLSDLGSFAKEATSSACPTGDEANQLSLPLLTNSKETLRRGSLCDDGHDLRQWLRRILECFGYLKFKAFYRCVVALGQGLYLEGPNAFFVKPLTTEYSRRQVKGNGLA